SLCFRGQGPVIRIRRPVVTENSGNPVLYVMVPFLATSVIVLLGQTIADPSGVMVMTGHWYSVCPISAVLASVTAGRLAASRLPPAVPRLSSRTLVVWPADQLNASVRWLAGQDSDQVAKCSPMVPPVADQVRLAPP